jgi:hypothetical protein
MPVSPVTRLSIGHTDSGGIAPDFRYIWMRVGALKTLA